MDRYVKVFERIEMPDPTIDSIIPRRIIIKKSLGKRKKKNNENGEKKKKNENSVLHTYQERLPMKLLLFVLRLLGIHFLQMPLHAFVHPAFQKIRTKCNHRDNKVGEPGFRAFYDAFVTDKQGAEGCNKQQKIPSELIVASNEILT